MPAIAATYHIDALTFVRAGSDYVPGVWTANVVDDGNRFKLGSVYAVERRDGSKYHVKATKREKMNGLDTVRLKDAD